MLAAKCDFVPLQSHRGAWFTIVYIENIPGSLAGFSPRLRYLLIDEGAYTHLELESLKNLVSLLFQIEKTPVKEVTRELLTRLIDWVSENRELQRAFVVFLKRVYFRDRVDVEALYREARDAGEVKDMLSKNVERWIEEWKAEGRAEGKVEGRAEGKVEGRAEGDMERRRSVARKLLATGMPVLQICEITELLEKEVRALSNIVTH